ncbi:hypothetical protein GCM10010365_72920 [Streptomyces poonensis]|uniref:Transcriptional regulator n=1 Tax=Streptomyces poonensis TaxID=68255 RepID=A0A918UY70_9ACTN|nr:hypothetical protein GCM10010365_72920 [Streptomyces poonensis]
MQLAILSWDALDERSWPGAADMEPADIARALGIYAQRVITPRGSTAVSGLELMTALRPPTRAVQDPATGNWVSGHHPGSLGTQPMDPAPPEATPGHPVVVNSGWRGGFLNEEAYQWVRDVNLLTDEECTLPFAVGLDLNTAFLASTARLVVGLSGPEHFVNPPFNPKVPGSWLVDLSHNELDPRLPSPFTPTGERPTGPAWYQTHTVAYAQQLGYNVQPLEAYLRRETGAYLDPWHDRLKTAYVDTLADLGVTVDLDDRQFLAALERHKDVDPALVAVLAAIKATIKGGVGKLRERPQGRHYKEGERWPALQRPTWRPDIRAAVISKARVNMHRKLMNMAKLTGLYPLALLSDCGVYPSPGDSPLAFLRRARPGSGWSPLTASPPPPKGADAVGEIEDAIERADREAFTREPPKTLKGQIGFLLKQLKTTRAVAAELGVSQRSVERYRKGEHKHPPKDIQQKIDAAVRARWQPQVRKRRRKQAASTGGITVETRARFGCTAPIGTTDDGRFRRLTVHLPRRTRSACSTPATPGRATSRCARSSPIADGFKEVYFQDGGARAMGLSDVAINDIDYLDLDF